MDSKLLSTKNSQNDIMEYWDAKNINRRWELGIDYKTKFYLTDDEAEYYFRQVFNGINIIRIGEMILTSKFQYLVPIRNKKVEKRVDPVINSEGKIISYKEV